MFKKFSETALFKYVNDKGCFNLNELIKILKTPTNNMILDIKNKVNEINEKQLKYTPLVIDFDVKDESVFTDYNYDEMVNDIKNIVSKSLDDYVFNEKNYDKTTFKKLLSICQFDSKEIDNIEKEINGIENDNKDDNKDNNNNKDDKNKVKFKTAIVQKKNSTKFNFHIIYPFVIIENKTKIYDKIRLELNKKYGINFKKIVDESLKSNCLRVINCSKKGKCVDDEYYIDVKNSDVSKEFKNTERIGEIDEKHLRLNIMLCSLQWSRCGAITDYTFTEKQTEQKTDKQIEDKQNKPKEKIAKEKVIKNKDKLKFGEFDENGEGFIEVIEKTKYTIEDVIYVLDNLTDDYWKYQSYDEWRDIIWSCCWFKEVIKDDNKIILHKLKDKSNLYYDGFNKKAFNQIMGDYDNERCDKVREKLIEIFKKKQRDKYEERFGFDNNIVREEIEEIKLNDKNCDMNLMKKLLKEKKYDELIDYYIHYFYRTNDGYYYYNNKNILKNNYKTFEEDKLSVIYQDERGKNKKITLGKFIDDNIEKVRFVIDDSVLTNEYDDKPLLYKINYYNKNDDVVSYELHINNSFIVREWTKSKVFNYDFNKDVDNILNDEKVKEGYDVIMHHIKHIICKDNNNKINYLMSFTKNIFNKRRNATAPIFYGDRRIGKSVFCQLFQKMMPNLYCSSANGDIIKTDKNGAIFDNMICVLEEVSDDFKTAAETCQRIKEFITAETVGCRKLFCDQKQMINRTSFIINTNNIESIYFDGKDDARYVVFEVSNEHKEDLEYFRKINDAYNNINVLRYFYWNVKNSKYDYDTRIVLNTEEKIKAINKKFNSVYVDFLEQLFLEMYLNKMDKVLLKNMWMHFNIHYSKNKKIKMKDFNNELRNNNVIIKEVDKNRNYKEFISFDKLQSYIINDLKLYDNVENINKNDIEIKIFGCFNDIDIE